MRHWVRHSFVVLGICALSISAAMAESKPLSDTTDAAAEASLFQPWDESRRVSFEAVLADPDNVELNFRYAQTLLHDGRPKDAVPTLQRILTKQPDLAQVRLLYTFVLLRLDNLAEAERELAIVQKAQMSDSQRKDLDRLAKDIRQRRKPTRWDIRLGLGMQYDQNRSAAPASGEAEISSLSSSIDLNGTPFEKENDLAFVTSLDARVQHDLRLNGAGQPKLIGGIRFQSAEQVELDYLDLMAFEVSGGAQFHVGGGLLTSELLYNQVLFSSETYLRSGGMRLKYERAVADRLKLGGRFQAEYQDYDEINDNPIADRRSGWRYEYALRGDYIWNANHFSGVELYAIDQNAKHNGYAFKAPGLSLAHLWIPKKNHFFVSRYSYEYHIYDGENAAITNRHRRDSRSKFRFTYGATLDEIMPFVSLPSGIDDIVASVSADFIVSDSNIRNYEYRNNAYSLMFTKRWKL